MLAALSGDTLVKHRGQEEDIAAELELMIHQPGMYLLAGHRMTLGIQQANGTSGFAVSVTIHRAASSGIFLHYIISLNASKEGSAETLPFVLVTRNYLSS
jgi:hypothetical protein